MKRLPALCALILLAVYPASCDPVTKAEELNWIRHVIPLPKSISIKESVTLPRGSISVVCTSEKSVATDQAIEELRDIVGQSSGVGSFTIKMAIGGDGARPLKSLKNSDQSYRIVPGKSGLTLVALTPRGLYYAAKTLQQLVAARSTADKLVIPLVEVTDWPDMEDRGLWGTDSEAKLRWMGDRKMNYHEMISSRHVSPEGVATSQPKSGRSGPMLMEGPRYGINPVPVVLHLEQLTGSGVFTAFPNLRAKSEKDGAWCYSQPQAAEVIAGWIADLSGLPNVKEVDVWLSENMNGKIGCQCDLCKAEKVDPQVLEARTVVKAWRLAKKRTGRDVGLRILTSEACEHFNHIILPELPREVKVVYYHSLLTYTHSRLPMIHDYLVDFVKKGGWLAVCPSLGGIPNYPSPMTCPQFINTRMKEYLGKGLKGILGYASPGIMYTDLNVEAAAEWAWNLNGRSIREFCVSYAVRQGYADPEKFADLVDVMGAVEARVYACDWPWRASRKMVTPVDIQLKEGTLPELGAVLHGFNGFPFGGFTAEKQLDDAVISAAKAVERARALGIEEYIQESLVIQGYAKSIKALHELRKTIRGGKVALEDKARAAESLQACVDGLRQSAEALPKWEQTVTWRGNDVSRNEQAVAKIVRGDLMEKLLGLATELGVVVK